jgi:hypothetical protein
MVDSQFWQDQFVNLNASTGLPEQALNPVCTLNENDFAYAGDRVVSQLMDQEALTIPLFDANLQIVRIIGIGESLDVPP